MDDQAKTLEQSQQSAKIKVEKMLKQVTDARFGYFSGKISLEDVEDLEKRLASAKLRREQLDKISVEMPHNESDGITKIVKERHDLSKLVKEYGDARSDIDRNRIKNVFSDKLQLLRDQMREHQELSGIASIARSRDKKYLDLPENKALKALTYSGSDSSSGSGSGSGKQVMVKRKGISVKSPSKCVVHHGNQKECIADSDCYWRPSSKKCFTRAKKAIPKPDELPTGSGSGSGSPEPPVKRFKVRKATSSKGIHFYKSPLEVGSFTVDQVLNTKLIPDDVFKPKSVSFDKSEVIKRFQGDMRRLSAEFILSLFYKLIQEKKSLPHVATRKVLASAVETLSSSDIKKRLLEFIGPTKGSSSLKFASDKWWSHAVGNLMDALNTNIDD